MGMGGPLWAKWHNNITALKLAHLTEGKEWYTLASIECQGQNDELTNGKVLLTISNAFIAGMEEWSQGYCQAAINRWRQFLQYYPKNSLVAFWVGIAETRLGHFDFAAQILRLAQAQKNVVSLVVHAMESGHSDELLRWLVVAAKTEETIPLIETTARQYFAVGRKAEAVELLRRFSEVMTPATIDYWQIAGLKERLAGNPARAIQYFLQGLKINANDLDLLYEARTAAIDVGDYKLALELALREFELTPQRPQSHLTIAWIYRLLEDYTLAKQWALKAKKINSNWWAVYYELGIIDCHGGHKQAALTAFDIALNLTPEQLDTMIARSKCLYELGDTNAAIQSAEGIVQKHHSNHDSRLINLYLALGQWYMLAGRTNDATQLYQSGLKIWPDAHWLTRQLDAATVK
jgi:tetratricopeptide (TPR) repeat protein